VDEDGHEATILVVPKYKKKNQKKEEDASNKRARTKKGDTRQRKRSRNIICPLRTPLKYILHVYYC